MNDIILLGANGQLGKELKSLGSKYNLFDFSKNEIEISNFESVNRLLNQHKNAIIINAAAYTKVDKAEEETEKCLEVNAIALENLSKACYANDCHLIHYSTDYVFDGENSTAYKETDLCEPVNFYGKSKLLGENLIAKNLEKHYILRTSWVYGKYGNNFPKKMYELMSNTLELNIVNDQIGTPTSTYFLKKITDKIISNILNGIPIDYGVYHAVPNGFTSWYDFAKLISLDFEKQNSRKINVKPVSSSNFKTDANRPKFSKLDNTKIKMALDYDVKEWDDYYHIFSKEMHE